MIYTGFWRRFAAYIIDGIILTIPGLMVGGASHFGVGLGVNIILGLLYYPIFECSIMSATPGKALLGMVVLTEAGERLTFKTAIIRYFTRFLSVLIGYIGYLMQVFTSKRQTLHDMMSETVVIDKKSEDLNYFTVWKDQFKEIINKL